MVPCAKGAENKTEDIRGDSGSNNRQTSTTTSMSGSRRSARHPHCFTSAMPMALPISYKGEEQSQAIKTPRIQKTADHSLGRTTLRNPREKKDSMPKRTTHTIHTRRGTTGQSR